jgi:hypothetical protein
VVLGLVVHSVGLFVGHAEAIPEFTTAETRRIALERV